MRKIENITPNSSNITKKQQINEHDSRIRIMGKGV